MGDVNIYGIYNDCITRDPDDSPVATDDDDVWFTYYDDTIIGTDDGNGQDVDIAAGDASFIEQRLRHLRHNGPSKMVPDLKGLSNADSNARVKQHIKATRWLGWSACSGSDSALVAYMNRPDVMDALHVQFAPKEDQAWSEHKWKVCSNKVDPYNR